MNVETGLDTRLVRDLLSGKVRKRIHTEASLAVRDGLALLQMYHKTKVIRRGAGKSPPVKRVWSQRTGEASRSFHIDWKRGDLEGAYGSELQRMKILEEGGDIKAKPGKALAIPLPAARMGVGGGASPRYFPDNDTFILERQEGGRPPLLVRRVGDQIEPLFVLLKKVTLPPRPTLERAAKEKGPELAAKLIERVGRAVDRAE